MNSILQSIQTYSAPARREEKARRRRHDLQLTEAGKAAEAQAANRLIPNPEDWRLEANDDLFAE